MSASLTSSAIFSAAGRKLDMVAECNLFHLILYFQGDVLKYLINLSLMVQSVQELEPDIDSAGGCQNLPWNYVEIVVGGETRNRFCWGFPESTMELC